jgi:signal transduction histidine kinase
MYIFRSRPTKSFAVNRIVKLIARVLSIGLVISSAEIYLYGFAQLPLLNAPLATAFLFLHIASLAWIVYGAWFTERPAYSQRGYTIVSVLLVFTWQFQVPDPSILPEGYHPWVWWVIGTAGIAAAVSLPLVWGLTYLIGIPVVWFFVQISPAGGSAEAFGAFKDSMYTALFSSSFSLLLLLLIDQAEKTDEAAQAAAEAEAERARIDAIEQERSRVDSLVHDKVLTTLLVTAKANDPQRISEAKALADAAIKALEDDAFTIDSTKTDITSFSLFGAFLETVKTDYPDVTIRETGASDLQIPNRVAAALSEATIQAITNSKQHAGPGAECVVRMKGGANGIKIVIKDDGKGFRPSRVPKNRLGLRLSIINRVESVGGTVKIDSAPGRGSAIILEWNNA